MLRSFIEGLPDPDTAWREHERAQPLGRLARPEESRILAGPGRGGARWGCG
jgi:hypothetical protein